MAKEKMKSKDGTYDWVKAIVREDGISMSYKCSELSNTGSDFLDDESANTWTDRDIRKTVASYLGIESGQEQIEVIFD